MNLNKDILTSYSAILVYQLSSTKNQSHGNPVTSRRLRSWTWSEDSGRSQSTESSDVTLHCWASGVPKVHATVMSRVVPALSLDARSLALGLLTAVPRLRFFVTLEPSLHALLVFCTASYDVSWNLRRVMVARHAGRVGRGTCALKMARSM